LNLSAQTDSAIDYADNSNWAVLPCDSTDHWSARVGNLKNSDIDVFFVYPTLLTSVKDKRWNYPIQDERHRENVVETIVKYQASAWAEAGNFYMPFYRQAHLRSYYHLEDGGRKALMLAYSDVKNAFDYYLQHHNKGHGIILAGHSQGSTHIRLLLKEYFDQNNELRSQLVAAYIPGIGIPKDEFDSIPLMTDSSSVGGYVTWNTLKRRYKTKDYRNWYKGRAVINPVSWDQSEFVPRNAHKGFLYSNGKLYKQSFKTHSVDGAIWISTPRFPFRFRALLMRNYHIGDVNLFWEDIRVNALLRSKQYLLQR